MVDQALSAITNFALAVLVARTVSAEEFGAFGIAYAIYMLARGLSDAMWAAPVAIRHAASEPEARLDQVAASAGAAFATGTLAGLATLVVGLLFGGAIGEALVPLAICFPGLLVQDCWRQGFVTHAQPGKAAVNDLVWAILQLAGVASVIAVSGGTTIAPLMLVWGLSGTLAGALASVQARRAIKVRGVMRMVRDHRHLGPQFAGEFAANNGQAQVTLVALAAVSGTTATAGFRGAQVLFGPQRVLSSGLTLAVLPEGVRIRSRPDRLQWLVRALSVFNTAIVVVMGIVLLALPTSIGEALLGDSWSATSPVILPMLAYSITGTASSGPSIGLRVIERASTCLRIQLLVSPLAIVATVIGMIAAGAVGAAWGLAVAGAAGTVLWVTSWRREAPIFESSIQAQLGTTTESDVGGPTPSAH